MFLTDALTDAPRETSPLQTTPQSPDEGQSEWIKVLLYSGIPALVLTCCIAAILVRFRRKRSKSSDETLFIRYLENGNSDKPPTPKVKRPSIGKTMISKHIPHFRTDKVNNFTYWYMDLAKVQVHQQTRIASIHALVYTV